MFTKVDTTEKLRNILEGMILRGCRYATFVNNTYLSGVYIQVYWQEYTYIYTYACLGSIIRQVMQR